MRGADEIEGELFGDGGGSGSDFVYDVVWRGKWVGFESKKFSIKKWGKRVKLRHFKGFNSKLLRTKMIKMKLKSMKMTIDKIKWYNLYF
jgi:hypothetical protein